MTLRIDIVDFADTPMHLLSLDIKKYIMSMIPILLNHKLKQNQDFARSTSKSLYQCRENDLGWCNANKFTNKHGSVSTKGWESSHYQAFTRVSLSIYNNIVSIPNEDQSKCNSHKSFKQLSVLWYCLMSRMSNSFEMVTQTEPILWKVGKQVFGSMQRECS